MPVPFSRLERGNFFFMRKNGHAWCRSRPLGVTYIGYRLVLAIWLVQAALAAVKRSGNPLPILLVSFTLPILILGPMTLQGTANGFGWLFTGFSIAANNLRLSRSERAMNVLVDRQLCTGSPAKHAEICVDDASWIARRRTRGLHEAARAPISARRPPLLASPNGWAYLDKYVVFPPKLKRDATTADIVHIAITQTPYTHRFCRANRTSPLATICSP